MRRLVCKVSFNSIRTRRRKAPPAGALLHLPPGRTPLHPPAAGVPLRPPPGRTPQHQSPEGALLHPPPDQMCQHSALAQRRQSCSRLTTLECICNLLAVDGVLGRRTALPLTVLALQPDEKRCPRLHLPRCLSSVACCRGKLRRVQPSITVQRRCELALPCDQRD